VHGAILDPTPPPPFPPPRLLTPSSEMRILVRSQSPCAILWSVRDLGNKNDFADVQDSRNLTILVGYDWQPSQQAFYLPIYCRRCLRDIHVVVFCFHNKKMSETVGEQWNHRPRNKLKPDIDWRAFETCINKGEVILKSLFLIFLFICKHQLQPVPVSDYNSKTSSEALETQKITAPSVSMVSRCT